MFALSLLGACANDNAGAREQPTHEPEPAVESSGSVQGAGRSSVSTQGGRGGTTPGSSQPVSPLAEVFVAAHDQGRAGVEPAAEPALPPVSWSDELAARAQAWADHCEFEHSDTDLGENLSARTDNASPADIVASWVAEGADYNYARNRCASGRECGHYTQVVWRDSTQIGCGVAECPGGGPFGDTPWFFVVCSYSPAGNWTGQRPY